MAEDSVQYDLLLPLAQKTVENQIAAGAAIEVKLSAVVTQSTTLASAALTAAAVSTLKLGATEVPPWLSAGLLVVGLSWAVAAMIAQYGTRPIRWMAPTVRPKDLFDAGIDLSQRTSIYVELICALDRAANANQELCVQRARSLWAASFLFLLALPAGLSASAAVALATSVWWPVPIMLLVFPVVAGRLWRHVRSTIVA